jgi:hypothetical protein
MSTILLARDEPRCTAPACTMRVRCARAMAPATVGRHQAKTEDFSTAEGGATALCIRYFDLTHARALATEHYARRARAAA